ncbi:MAG: DUF192 domain-containing protein [Actinomycetota bacterium]|nr:DUF192 domain-containing protein [Actinomycetota bacterium]
MAWLVRGDRVLASLDVPDDRRGRMKGLIGREFYEGAMLLTRCRSVHTFGMKFVLDVAFVDGDGFVIDTVRIAPRRMSLPRLRSRQVVEARAGSFERWRLAVGDQIEIRK